MGVGGSILARLFCEGFRTGEPKATRKFLKQRLLFLEELVGQARLNFQQTPYTDTAGIIQRVVEFINNKAVRQDSSTEQSPRIRNPVFKQGSYTVGQSNNVLR